MTVQPTGPWYELAKLVVGAVLASAFGWTIWTFVIGRLAAADRRAEESQNDAKVAVGNAQDKFERSLLAALERDREVAGKFANVLDRYNESNAETARQLSILAKSVRMAMAKKDGDSED